MARWAKIAANIILICLAVFLSKLLWVPFPAISKTADSLEISESFLNFTERSTRHGYNSDQHTVLTDDGYILTLFHLWREEGCLGKSKPPILLMHGLLMSSDTWLDPGPDASLAYLLSDECFDIWVGNIRGNHYGRNHAKLDPNVDHQFWDFSTDEMGAYDVPAIVDYVLKKTGWEKLDYIGYSQGGGVLLIMCSERPTYCAKIQTFIALAPAAWPVHLKSTLLRSVLKTTRFVNGVLDWFKFKEMFPKGGVGQALLSFLCQYDALVEIVCRGGLTIIDSYHEGSIKAETLKVLYANFPTGTSVRTCARYGQAFNSESCQKFDHGEDKNLELYGVPKPPQYNTRALTAPTVIIYGKNDHLVDVKDVEWLSENLPNVIEKVAVADPLWNHFDFMYSQHIRSMVFPTILKNLLRDHKG